MSHEIVEGIDVCLTRTLEAPAWHQLDRRFDLLSADVLRSERFARPVALGTVQAVSDGVVVAPAYRAVIADPQGEAPHVVAIVSPKYCAPVDGYGSLVRLIEPLLEAGLLSVVSAGTLRGYAKAYMTCELGKGLIAAITGDDVIKRYWTLTDALDGKHARTSFGSNVRVVCANTLASANADAVGRRRLRHAANFELRSEAWRDLILAEQALLDAEADTLRQLAAKQVDAAALDAYLRDCFELAPGVEGDRANSRLLFATATHDADQARGTLWGAYNAAQASLQWFGRGGRQAQARLDGMFFGTAMQTNQTYLNNALALL